MPIQTIPPWNILTITDVTASRVTGVDYTNSSGRTMFVSICTEHEVDNSATAYLEATVGGLLRGRAGIFIALGLAGQVIVIHGGMSFVVPPGSVYRVDEMAVGGGINTIHSWIESM